jgi:hypothetical protein
MAEKLEKIIIPTRSGRIILASNQDLSGLNAPQQELEFFKSLFVIEEKIEEYFREKKDQQILLGYPTWNGDPELLWPENWTEKERICERPNTNGREWQHIFKIKTKNNQTICSRGYRPEFLTTRDLSHSLLSEISCFLKCKQNEEKLPISSPQGFGTIIFGKDEDIKAIHLVEYFTGIQAGQAEFGHSHDFLRFKMSLQEDLKAIGITYEDDLRWDQFLNIGTGEKLVLIDMETATITQQ